mmetsp:Transcript_2837/g.6805  ORF Transcript_2837/g.6805 Transcript_2837/m.6805 type:complete len:1037 (+) Transcript_2837:78-3188(+)
MANNQAPAQMMYYYVTMPQQGQGQYPQDGQMQGQTMQQPNFVDQSQMQNFMAGQQYGFVQAQDGNNGMNMQMGQVPMMAANGAAMGMPGQQVMLVMGMPNQQGQQMMDQGHQQGGWACGGQDANAQQGQNQVGGHPMMMPQQQAFQPQQQQQQQFQQMPQQQQQQQQQPQQPQQQSSMQQMRPARADAKDEAEANSASQPAEAPAPAVKAGAKKKGLANKKLEKATDKKEPTPAEASAPAPATTAAVPAQSSTPAPAPAQAEEAERPAGQEGTESGSTSGQVSRWPDVRTSVPNASAKQNSFASSIKALNLEPMRANNQPAKTNGRPLRTPVAPLELPAAATQAPTQTQQSQQPQPQQSSPTPAPVQPQEQPKPLPAPTPAPAPTAQSAPTTTGTAVKAKGFKLKNAALTKPTTTKTETDESKEEKPAPAPAPPVVQVVEEPAPVAITDTSEKKVNLMPANKVLDRELMLRIWRLHRSEKHASVFGLGTGERPSERATPDIRRSTTRPTVSSGNDIRRPTRAREPVLKPGENAYKPTEPQSRLEELERRVRGLLNKICPDNLKTIVETLAQIDLQKAEELEFVIKIIFGKALVEPHYCETYADMVFALRTRYPEFPAENEGEKPHSFTRVLLNTVQNEFESLPTTFEPTDEDRKKFESTEDLNLEMKKRKGKMLANMKFIGNLFLRQLLAVKVIGQVVHDLIGIKQGENPLPEEHMIECVCELLQAIGYTLDETQQGESLMNSFAARLKDLSGVRNNGKHAYSKRIQFQIDGLLELRKNKWMKKLFKEQAKTKNAVREEAEREQRQHGRTVGPDNMFSVQTVGVRPAYMDEISAAKKRTKQVDAGASKPKFDKQYVKKICQYYGEDQQGDTLQEDWSKAQPTKEETKQGLEWLLETGFDDPNKQDVTAQVMVELVRRRLIPWDMLKDSLTNSLASLPDMKMDTPTADVFVHSLFARLLMLGDGFNAVVLKALQTFVSSDDNKKLGWSLLVGIMKRLKSDKATEIVQKALQKSEFISIAATAKGCTAQEAKKQLESS